MAANTSAEGVENLAQGSATVHRPAAVGHRLVRYIEDKSERVGTHFSGGPAACFIEGDRTAQAVSLARRRRLRWVPIFHCNLRPSTGPAIRGDMKSSEEPSPVARR